MLSYSKTNLLFWQETGNAVAIRLQQTAYKHFTFDMTLPYRVCRGLAKLRHCHLWRRHRGNFVHASVCVLDWHADVWQWNKFLSANCSDAGMALKYCILKQTRWWMWPIVFLMLIPFFAVPGPNYNRTAKLPKKIKSLNLEWVQCSSRSGTWYLCWPACLFFFFFATDSIIVITVIIQEQNKCQLIDRPNCQ